MVIRKFENIPHTRAGYNLVKKVAVIWAKKGNVTPDKALAIYNEHNLQSARKNKGV